MESDGSGLQVPTARRPFSKQRGTGSAALFFHHVTLRVAPQSVSPGGCLFLCPG